VPRPAPGETRVALGATREVGGTHRVVVFRRPLESRAGSSGQGERELVRLIHEVVVEEVAGLLGVPPEEVEP